MMFRTALIGLAFFMAFTTAPLRAQEDIPPLDIDPPVAAPPVAVDAAPAEVPAPEAPVEAVKTKDNKGFLALLQAGGPIGYLIILLSLVAVALVIEHALTIRQKILMPPGFADEILQMLSQGQLGAALQKCKEGDSILADVLAAGMAEYEFGWQAVEKATEEAMAEEASRLYRKIEYLNVIGNITPMLGLLGTVVGMIFAFQNLADSEGYARAGDLAEGIYLALVTTVEGPLALSPSFCSDVK